MPNCMLFIGIQDIDLGQKESLSFSISKMVNYIIHYLRSRHKNEQMCNSNSLILANYCNIIAMKKKKESLVNYMQHAENRIFRLNKTANQVIQIVLFLRWLKIDIYFVSAITTVLDVLFGYLLLLFFGHPNIYLGNP